MAKRIDFSANAPVYDCRHGPLLPPQVALELAREGDLQPGSRVLDLGAGTGRVAIAFAAIECQTVALDPALPMLDEVRRKAPGRIECVAGEGARLPFSAGCFDAAILARILYLVSDWQMVLRQVRDVLKPGGRLFHEWANGESDEQWVQVREKARALFQDAGIRSPFHPGARSESEVDAFLAALDFVRTRQLPSGPGCTMTLREFVARIVSGEFLYIWGVPKAIQGGR